MLHRTMIAFYSAMEREPLASLKRSTKLYRGATCLSSITPGIWNPVPPQAAAWHGRTVGSLTAAASGLCSTGLGATVSDREGQHHGARRHRQRGHGGHSAFGHRH